MKSKLNWILVLIVVAVFGLLTVSGYAQRQRSSRTLWEYKITQPLAEKELNELGAQGWELVEIKLRTFNGETSQELYYFKRAK